MVHNLLKQEWMKLKIETETIGGVAVVQVHGRLAGNGVNELEKICRLGSRPLALDLSNLYSVDPRGIDFIRSLVKEGVDLIGISPYIRLLLAVVE
jgi:anti-anti-sigma regulatory factor